MYSSERQIKEATPLNMQLHVPKIKLKLKYYNKHVFKT